MVAGKLTSKGQITIPKQVRESMGLKAGDIVEFVTKGEKTSIRRARPKENPFLQFIGMDGGYFKSRKEINAWIAEMRDPD